MRKHTALINVVSFQIFAILLFSDISRFSEKHVAYALVAQDIWNQLQMREPVIYIHQALIEFSFHSIVNFLRTAAVLQNNDNSICHWNVHNLVRYLKHRYPAFLTILPFQLHAHILGFELPSLAAALLAVTVMNELFEVAANFIAYSNYRNQKSNTNLKSFFDASSITTGLAVRRISRSSSAV